MKVSLLAPALITALGALTVAAAVATWRARRQPVLRTLTAGFTLMGLLLTAAALVNDYFDYVPTLGALLGQRAQDQASRLEIRHVLALHSLRPHILHGLVEQVTIPAPVSGFGARTAQVYLPPAWFVTPRPALPVIELLHGTPGMTEDWTRAGAADVTADQWAAGHNGVAPIIVMVDENGGFLRDTECVDGTQGNSETYLTVDVRNWVLAHLGASPAPAQWAIAGSSEGGYCALDLALRHPTVYRTFLDFAGLDRPTYSGGTLGLFGGSRRAWRAHLPRLLLATHNPAYNGLAGWFEVGSADGGTTVSVLKAESWARAAGIATRLVLVPNAHHTWRVFRHSFADAFPWAAARIGATGV